jgi:poly-gamma-glutamate capsule biosynthesis protein CapA/YwtB (metallophosphatase superfamily)
MRLARPSGLLVYAWMLLLLTSCGLVGATSGSRLPNPGVVRILLAGDVMLGRGVAPVVENDPWSVFNDAQYEIRSADIAVANLESPLTTRPHVAETPYALEADPSAARLLRSAGFEAMSVANNHAGDAGTAGFEDTLSALERAGITALGAGPDASAAVAPKIVTVSGVRVALLAFDATGQGPSAGEATAGVATWNAAAAKAAVTGARASSDLVVVGLHGGIEYSSVPDPYILGIARLLAGWGADVVWASGPHVVQPVRTMSATGTERPTVVATSLGNLLFDQTQPGTTNGAVLEVFADRAGVIAYRVGRTEGTDLRVHFERWSAPVGDAVDLEGSWWSLARDVNAAPPVAPVHVPMPPGRRIRVQAAAVGDVDGDGRDEIVLSYRSSFHPTLVNAALPGRRWRDSHGLAWHVGVWRAGSVRPVWIAGTVLRPVAALAICGGHIAVAYTDVRGRGVRATGAWEWSGFGFSADPDLAGRGTPGCADVDHTGSLEPVVLDRMQIGAHEGTSR